MFGSDAARNQKACCVLLSIGANGEIGHAGDRVGERDEPRRPRHRMQLLRVHLERPEGQEAAGEPLVRVDRGPRPAPVSRHRLWTRFQATNAPTPRPSPRRSASDALARRPYGLLWLRWCRDTFAEGPSPSQTSAASTTLGPSAKRGHCRYMATKNAWPKARMIFVTSRGMAECDSG